MTGAQLITTFVGGFAFPFFIRMIWGAYVDQGKAPVGGLLSAAFIVGTTWAVNHGVGMMHQTGGWVDMGYATFGLFAANAVVDKSDVGKGFVNLLFAIIGGLLGAFVVAQL